MAVLLIILYAEKKSIYYPDQDLTSQTMFVFVMNPPKQPALRNHSNIYYYHYNYYYYYEISGIVSHPELRHFP